MLFSLLVVYDSLQIKDLFEKIGTKVLHPVGQAFDPPGNLGDRTAFFGFIVPGAFFFLAKTENILFA
jgi:hypothetical protein